MKTKFCSGSTYSRASAGRLRKGTLTSAELLGVDGFTGTLEPGKAADIIAVDGNPFEDMRALRRVVFVMKDGVVEVRKP